MKKQIDSRQLNYFKFRFTATMITLAIAVLLLCLAGITLSILRIIDEGIHGFGDALKSPFLILICLFGIIIVVAMLIRSRYIVTEKDFITQFGFIKSRFAIKTITSILLDTEKKKLTVYMGEEYFVVTTNPEWNNDLVQALRSVNKDIDFSFTMTDSSLSKNKKD